jgi:2-polyprenyl-3-methyl-5-hydroxy-6-metoxy-1,4-benzoquinol methylase
MAAADPRARHPARQLDRIPGVFAPLRRLAQWRQRHRVLPFLGDTRLRAEREADLLRWSVKVLGSEMARQHYAAGLAGPAAPVPAGPVAIGLGSRVCRQADIEHDWLRHWCARQRAAPVYHRKLWEDCYVLQALWEAGMLAPGRRALGFAVGREALPAFLAAEGVEVLATDLDPGDARARDWIRTGQHAQERLFQPELLDRADFDRLVSFRAVDMTRIPEDLQQGGFDLVWSVCAMEHLGTLERGLDFVLAAMRCLRPGGIAVHTTEYNMDAAGGTLRRGTTVLYQRRHLEALAARLAAAGHAMLPLDEAQGAGMMDRFVDLPPYAEAASPLGVVFPPHLRLSVRGYPVTSAGILVRAGDAGSIR